MAMKPRERVIFATISLTLIALIITLSIYTVGKQAETRRHKERAELAGLIGAEGESFLESRLFIDGISKAALSDLRDNKPLSKDVIDAGNVQIPEAEALLEKMENNFKEIDRRLQSHPVRDFEQKAAQQLKNARKAVAIHSRVVAQLKGMIASAETLREVQRLSQQVLAVKPEIHALQDDLLAVPVGELFSQDLQDRIAKLQPRIATLIEEVQNSANLIEQKAAGLDEEGRDSLRLMAAGLRKLIMQLQEQTGSIKQNSEAKKAILPKA